MNYGSSNAKALTEKNYAGDREKYIVRTSYTERKNHMKQRLCGLALIAAAVFAVLFANDMELVLGVIPFGIYLMFTKKTILPFSEK